MTEEVITLQYALDPTTKQKVALSSHSGAARFAYNWALGRIYANWDDVKSGKTNDYLSTSAYSLRRDWNTLKDDIAPWWKENSKEAYNTGFSNAQSAFNNFYKKRSGPPRYKRKSPYSSAEGVIFTTGIRRLEADKRHFTLPIIGTVRLHERANKLSWLLAHGARITNVTVKFARTRWFVSVITRVPEPITQQYHLHRTRRDKKPVVGVDVGIKNAAVFSDGTVIDNPRSYEKALKKLRKANKRLSRRQGFNKKTGEAASNRYLRSKRQLAKQYARVANRELDFAHKISKQLVDSYDLISIEDLNVSGMVRNRRLSRHIAHASFGRLKVMLEYKASWYRSQVHVVDRFYPSSKTCSDCGEVKAKLSLSERVFECESCGFKIDRDLNAAVNLKNQAAQSCGEALNGRGDGSSDCLGTNSETAVCEASSRTLSV